MTGWKTLADRNQVLQRQLREAEAKLADVWDQGFEVGTRYGARVASAQVGMRVPTPTNPHRKQTGDKS